MKHIERVFNLSPGSFHRVGFRGTGVKNFSTAICDGALSTLRSSLLSKFDMSDIQFGKESICVRSIKYLPCMSYSYPYLTIKLDMSDILFM